MATAPVFRAARGLNNVIEPHRLGYSEDGACYFVEAVNVIVDDGGSFKRRFGKKEVRLGDAHSLWSSNEFCLFVSGGDLYRILPDMSVVLVTASVGDIAMCYVELAGKVYCSNGIIGLVVTDSTVTNWVASVPTKMPGDERVLGMPGYFSKMVIHGGRLFGLAGNILWQSEPGMFGCFDLANGAIPFTVVHDFVSVGSGMYVSCEDGIVYLEGTSKENFERKVVYSKGCVPGTMTVVDGSDVGDGTDFFGQTAVWVTRSGVCFGDARGFVKNKTSQYLSFNAGISGAGVGIPGQYFFSLEV